MMLVVMSLFGLIAFAVLKIEPRVGEKENDVETTAAIGDAPQINTTCLSVADRQPLDETDLLAAKVKFFKVWTTVGWLVIVSAVLPLALVFLGVAIGAVGSSETTPAAQFNEVKDSIDSTGVGQP